MIVEGWRFKDMKVLIVDDEIIVRVGLKSIIDWESNGFELVGEAADGRKALEIIKEKQPQIVICDIKMPVMDGIELLKKIKDLNNPPKVIIMSSYNDFQFVKEAMKLGAEEYILKMEMESEGLVKILQETKRKIEFERENEFSKLKLNSQVRVNINHLRKKFLKDFLSSKLLKDQDFIESKSIFEINLELQNVCCFIMKIGELYKFETMEESDVELLNFSIINITEEIIRDNYKGYCFETKTGEFCILVSVDEGKESRFNDNELYETAKRLNDMLEQYLNISVVIGISKIESGITGIRQSYSLARKSLEYRFFKGDGKIISWKEVGTFSISSDSKFSILQFKEKIQKFLEYRSEEDLKNIFGVILESFSKAQLDFKSAIKIQLELYYMISEFFEKQMISSKEILKKSHRDYQQLMYAESISQIEKWITNVLQDLLEYLGKEKDKDYPRAITKAKKYIEDNYEKEISLKEVATVINFNPSYFSTIFAQYVGCSYTQYLTNIRIEHGRTLLRESDYKVYEIAEMIGYQNLNYFNRIFKKVTGLTPLEFKNS